MTGRLKELDALRGIAAVGVVLYHYFYRFDEIYNPSDLWVDWAFFGTYGVQLFFTISGFVIFWSLQRINHPFDFVRARFARLYPSYWVAIILTFAVVSVFGRPESDPTWTELAFNFSMFHQLFHVRHIDQVYWTLTIELMFYLHMFLLLSIDRLRWAEGVLATLVAVSILTELGVLPLSQSIQGLLILKHLPFFLIGLSMFKLVNGQATRTTLLALALAVVAVGVIFPPEHLPLFAAMFVIFYLAVSGRMLWLASAPLVYLGGISYALYLVHQYIGYAVIRQALAQGVPLLGAIAMALCLSFGLAHLIRTHVEVPAGRYLRQRWR